MELNKNKFELNSNDRNSCGIGVIQTTANRIVFIGISYGLVVTIESSLVWLSHQKQ
jgi:hypothetical protein